MSEADNQAAIRIALGREPRVRLFRNNRGQFWAGQVIDQRPGTVTLARPRRVECGLVNGASDLIGWTSRVVTQDMVGKPIALFTAVEVKSSTGPVKADQWRFIDHVNGAGGIAVVARTVEQALELVRP